jgi:hypothetical protein
LASFVIQFFSPLAKVKDEQQNGITELRDVPEKLKYVLSLSLSHTHTHTLTPSGQSVRNSFG